MSSSTMCRLLQISVPPKKVNWGANLTYVCWHPCHSCERYYLIYIDFSSLTSLGICVTRSIRAMLATQRRQVGTKWGSSERLIAIMLKEVTIRTLAWPVTRYATASFTMNVNNRKTVISFSITFSWWFSMYVVFQLRCAAQTHHVLKVPFCLWVRLLNTLLLTIQTVGHKVLAHR